MIVLLQLTHVYGSKLLHTNLLRRIVILFLYQPIMELSVAWIDWKERGAGDKDALLKIWSRIDGVYIPGLYAPEFDEKGFQTFKPRSGEEKLLNKKITRVIVKDLTGRVFRTPRSCHTESQSTTGFE